MAGYHDNLWPQFEITHLRQFFHHFKIDCVFDVGANAGQYARMIRQGVGFRGPIISFEPVPDLAERLRADSSRDPNWHIVETALDRDVRDATFHVMKSTTFSSLKSPRHVEDGRFVGMNSVSRDIALRTSTLAIEYPNWQSRIGFDRPFLKLDTQGSDIDVFEGAGISIRNFVGLQSELSIRRLYENSSYFDEAIKRYNQSGFVMSALVPNNAGHFPDLIEIDCIMYRSEATG